MKYYTFLLFLIILNGNLFSQGLYDGDKGLTGNYSGSIELLDNKKSEANLEMEYWYFDHNTQYYRGSLTIFKPKNAEEKSNQILLTKYFIAKYRGTQNFNSYYGSLEIIDFKNSETDSSYMAYLSLSSIINPYLYSQYEYIDKENIKRQFLRISFNTSDTLKLGIYKNELIIRRYNILSRNYESIFPTPRATVDSVAFRATEVDPIEGTTSSGNQLIYLTNKGKTNFTLSKVIISQFDLKNRSYKLIDFECSEILKPNIQKMVSFKLTPFFEKAFVDENNKTKFTFQLIANDGYHLYNKEYTIDLKFFNPK